MIESIEVQRAAAVGILITVENERMVAEMPNEAIENQQETFISSVSSGRIR